MGIRKLLAVAALVAGGVGVQGAAHSFMPAQMHMAEIAPCSNCDAAWSEGGLSQLTVQPIVRHHGKG